MDKTKIEEMGQLVKRLNYLNRQYYVENISWVTDKEYDKMYDRLRELEKETSLVLENSPTKKIGYSTNTVLQLEKKYHQNQMYSLDKTKDINSIMQWCAQHNIQKLNASLKADGLALELIYEFGYLKSAITRGDGIIGENVTHTTKTITNIPHFIEEFKQFDSIAVYGEALIPLTTFQKIATGNSEFKNPRNLASGSIRQLNPEICQQRHLIFLAYGIIPNAIYNYNEPTFTQTLLKLRLIGFDTVTDFEVDVNEESIKKMIEKFQMFVDTHQINYPIDGIVFRADDNFLAQKILDEQKQKSLHEIIKYPNYALAYKFEDNEYTTILKDVEWQCSRSGRINPIAILEPIEIDGTTVEKATLNNPLFIKQMMLGIGDEIVVRKANMIIPEIVGNLTNSDSLEIPTVCPSCGEPLTKRKNYPYLYCTNTECHATNIARIDWAASKEALNIVGLSRSRIESLVNRNIIGNLIDLYDLANAYKKYVIDKQSKDIPLYLKKVISDIFSIPKWGNHLFKNLMESVILSKVSSVAQFVYSLGIPNVGWIVASRSSKGLTNPQEWLDKARAQSLDIEYYTKTGELTATANSINEWINIDDNYEYACILGELLDCSDEFREYRDYNKGVTNKVLNSEKTDKLKGMVFAITGKYKNLNRRQFGMLVEQNGGIFTDDIRADTTHLFCAEESNSRKAVLARKKGIAVVNTEQFDKLLGFRGE